MASLLRLEDEDREWLDRLAQHWRVGKTHEVKCEEISDLVSVAEFKRVCAEITESPPTLQREEERELEQECNTRQLMPPRGLEPILKLESKDLPENSPLQCISKPKAVRAHLDRRNPLLNAVQMDGFVVPKSSAVLSSSEVLLFVYLYHPVKKHKEEEFIVLGSQKLTVLRDVITCPNDYFFSRDFSENPAARASIKVPPLPNPSPSAFFFINNTFYNDLRHPSATDYSRKIIEWCNEVPERIETSPRLDYFKTADMATTTFDQLSLRLGYPYLFFHHGNCEHIMVFNDLRKHHSKDCPCPDNYPFMRFRRRHKRRMCCVCGVNDPVWVTCNDMLATESPAFFCETCFFKLHYSQEGEKLTQFQAFPHFPGAF